MSKRYKKPYDNPVIRKALEDYVDLINDGRVVFLSETNTVLNETGLTLRIADELKNTVEDYIHEDIGYCVEQAMELMNNEARCDCNDGLFE